ETNQQVVFIQKGFENQIIPGNPNKILLSKISSLQPYKRLLPVGMQTYSKTQIMRVVSRIDGKVNLLVRDDTEKLIDLNEAVHLLVMIYEPFDPKKGKEWDVKSFLASLYFLSKHSTTPKQKVWLIARTNRNM